MARRKPHESWVAFRDPRTGDRLLRCRVCDTVTPPREYLLHKCKPVQVELFQGLTVQSGEGDGE